MCIKEDNHSQKDFKGDNDLCSTDILCNLTESFSSNCTSTVLYIIQAVEVNLYGLEEVCTNITALERMCELALGRTCVAEVTER